MICNVMAYDVMWCDVIWCDVMWCVVMWCMYNIIIHFVHKFTATPEGPYQFCSKNVFPSVSSVNQRFPTKMGPSHHHGGFDTKKMVTHDDWMTGGCPHDKTGVPETAPLAHRFLAVGCGNDLGWRWCSWGIRVFHDDFMVICGSYPPVI
jgi:hypothetical protein